jgi:hypothetical protein
MKPHTQFLHHRIVFNQEFEEHCFEL